MTGTTYILMHPGYRAVKVGYTSPTSKRLEEFGRRGWIVYRRLEADSPALARQVEQAVLFEIRHRRYIPPYLTPNEMRSCGWTETSSLSLITAREVWDIACEQAALIQLSPTIGSPPDGRRKNGSVPPRRRAGDTQPYSQLAKNQARIEQTPEKDAT